MANETVFYPSRPRDPIVRVKMDSVSTWIFLNSHLLARLEILFLSLESWRLSLCLLVIFRVLRKGNFSTFMIRARLVSLTSTVSSVQSLGSLMMPWSWWHVADKLIKSLGGSFEKISIFISSGNWRSQDASSLHSLSLLIWFISRTSFTSTNVKLRLRFDVHLTFTWHSPEPHLTTWPSSDHPLTLQDPYLT